MNDFDDDYIDPKWRRPYQVGFDAYYDGTKCPYENGTEEAYEWAKGWRSADIREECRYD